jgi:hypothetical protein
MIEPECTLHFILSFFSSVFSLLSNVVVANIVVNLNVINVSLVRNVICHFL